MSSSQTTPSSSPMPRNLALSEWKRFLADPPLTPGQRTVARAFLLGYGTNVVLDGVLPLALRRKSPREALGVLLNRVSVQSGTALALYAVVYRALLARLTQVRLTLLRRTWRLDQLDFAVTRDRIKARLIRLLHSPALVPFLAAMSASSTLAAFPLKKVRQSMALWLSTKAVESAYLELRANNSRATAWVPDWIGGAFFYAVANGQLLWSFLFEPECFPSSYGRVILSRSTSYIPPRPPGLPSSIPWPAPRDVADTIAILSTPTRTAAAYPSFKAPVLSALTPSKYPTSAYPLVNPVLDYAPVHPAHSRLLCAVLHPTEPSCLRNFIAFFAKEWQASAKFVAAFTAATQLLAYKKVLKDPETALFRFGLAVIQGATVISGSIGTAWGLTCFFQHYLPRKLLPKARYFLNGFLSSVFILAVPAARRAQLGSYVTRQSLDSSYAILRRRKLIRPIPQGDTLLLAFGLAILSALYETQTKANLDSTIARSIALLNGKSATLDPHKQAQLQVSYDHIADSKSQ